MRLAGNERVAVYPALVARNCCEFIQNTSLLQDETELPGHLGEELALHLTVLESEMRVLRIPW